MKKTFKTFLVASLVATSLAGCGSSDENIALNPAPDDAPGTALERAFVANPGPGLETVPTAHLNPLRGRTRTPIAAQAVTVGETTVIPVADLEADYETIFGSLSAQLGVTLDSPENARNISFIASQSATGNFNLDAQPILNNPLGVTGVAFTPLEYDTTVALPKGQQTFHVSGGLLTPEGITADQIKGVIVYFHGTTFNKSQVGSNYDGSIETQLNAQVFASQGYIVAIPDYVGQGVDWQTVHPYVLYPKVSAQTAVDMLAAIKPTLTQRYGLTEGQAPLKLFSAGYSEGGSYSLWFNSYLSAEPSRLDPLYRLTHSVGMEGAYSTSNVIYNYLFDDVGKRPNTYNIQNQLLTNFVKPILSADAFLSYVTYSLNSDYTGTFNPDFFNMLASGSIPQAALEVDDQQLDIATAFARPSTQIAPQLALSGLGKTSNGATYPSLASIIFSSKNSIDSLVTPLALTDEFQTELLKVLSAADADLTSVADNGVSIITLDQDSVVAPNNYDVLLSTFPSKIENAVTIDHTQLQVVSPYSALGGSAQWVPIDHLNGPPYEYLYALNIFNQH